MAWSGSGRGLASRAGDVHRQAPDREFITKREEELLMRTFLRVRPLAGLAALSACALVVAVPASLAGASVRSSNSGNQFRQTNLISNRTDQGAQVVDPKLQNPWGLALGPETPLWVADNNGGVATIYTITPGGAMAASTGNVVTLPGGRASTGDGPSP